VVAFQHALGPSYQEITQEVFAQQLLAQECSFEDMVEAVYSHRDRRLLLSTSIGTARPTDLDLISEIGDPAASRLDLLSPELMRKICGYLYKSAGTIPIFNYVNQEDRVIIDNERRCFGTNTLPPLSPSSVNFILPFCNWKSDRREDCWIHPSHSYSCVVRSLLRPEMFSMNKTSSLVPWKLLKHGWRTCHRLT
jgi:hypothetical protein